METDSNGGLETSWEKIKTLCDKGSGGDEEIRGPSGGRIIRRNGEEGSRRNIL